MKRPIRFAIAVVVALTEFLLPIAAFSDETEGVSIVEMDPTFAPLLKAHPFLMREGGAKFLRLPGGTNVLFAVGITDRRRSANPTAEAIRQRRVAESKAQKAITESLHAIHVTSFVQPRDITVIHRESGKEEVVEDLTDLLQRTESEVTGWILGLPVVGIWVLDDDDIFCLAIGRFFPPL